jgi:hypothetical protein
MQAVRIDGDSITVNGTKYLAPPWAIQWVRRWIETKSLNRDVTIETTRDGVQWSIHFKDRVVIKITPIDSSPVYLQFCCDDDFLITNAEIK